MARDAALVMPLITLVSGASFPAEAGESILNAAIRADIRLPYSCRSGRCNACKCKVVSGATTALLAEKGLSEQELANGWILGCARSAETDLVLDAEDISDTVFPSPKTLPCRIDSIERLAPDVIRVRLRLPPAAQFDFLPGQYIEVIGPGGIRRSYSLANSDFSDKRLELHIREVVGGAMSDYWFNQAKVEDLLRLHGPLGTFFLRPPADADLVFLATGTGIAPVKAILESVTKLAPENRPRSATLLWGGRTEEDLYFDAGSLVENLRFIPVLSRGNSRWIGAKGHVQDALLALNPDLRNATIYACGSDSMIHGAKAALVNAGLAQDRFYADAFVCSGSP